ncbi:hypothetical protein J4Q44_G00281740 [Coregonus suidteri]|uniref:Uncharacterized protein n=1 Tax=Coregonus suidteri TaxID=861788 RepID=A0AAN8QKH6_9TELE
MAAHCSSTITRAQDKLWKSPSKNCPRFRELMVETFGSEYYQRVLKSHQRNHNLTTPGWATQEIDSTLITLQAALDMYNSLLPPYTACELFEFYQEDGDPDATEYGDPDHHGERHPATYVTREAPSPDLRHGPPDKPI